jgi:prepilin-type N-terminal cleavage/methylation domain-containing protein
MSYIEVKLRPLRRTPTRAHLASRGFSLVELLAVVVISGLLAVAGVAMFRRHMVASRGSEATALLEGIRSAEHMYMSENHSYLNVSLANNGSQWYPQANPTNQRAAWMNHAHLDWPQWSQLGLPLNKMVLFSYLVNAGVPGTTIPALSSAFKAPPVVPVPPLDWYLIQAKGDTDGNGVFALYATTSLSNEIYSENDGD